MKASFNYRPSDLLRKKKGKSFVNSCIDNLFVKMQHPFSPTIFTGEGSKATKIEAATIDNS